MLATQMRPLGILAIITCLVTIWAVISGVPSLLVPLVWMGLLWLPGTLLLGKRPSLAEIVFLPLALSPLLVGLLATVCWGVGISLEPLLILLLGLAAFQTLRKNPKSWSPSRSQVWVLLLGMALVVIALIPSLFQEALRLRGDARLHIPIIHSVLLTGVPPENPFLAGERLPYFWFFHVILAVVTDTTRLSADWVLCLFSGQGIVLLFWGLWRWGGRLEMDTRSRALALFLVAFGLSPQGWMRLLQAQAQHPDLNWNLVHASGVSALFPILCPEDPRLVATFTKVAISNALPFSLGAGVVALSFYPKRNREWLLQTLLLLCCLGTHLAIGILILVGRLGLAFFSTVLKVESRNQLLKACLQTLLVMVIAAPYFWIVVESRDSGALTLGLFFRRAVDLQIPLIGLWILSLPAIGTSLRLKGRKLLVVFLTLIPAMALPLFARLIDGNEYKTAFFMVPLLALLAGSSLGRISGRRSLWLLVLLGLFLPTPYLAARAFLEEVPPGTMVGKQRESFEQLQKYLPTDAVLYKPLTSQGYSAHTIYLGRSNYLSDIYALQIMGIANHPTVRERVANVLQPTQRNTSPEELTRQLQRVEEELKRPLYVLASPSDRRLNPALSGGPSSRLKRVAERNGWLLMQFSSP